MTSKLKCPFCQTELIGNTQASYCNQCAIYGYNEIWNALIQAKQDLEIARKALEDIASGQIIEHSVCGHECDNKIFIARKALEQIEHKE